MQKPMGTSLARVQPWTPSYGKLIWSALQMPVFSLRASQELERNWWREKFINEVRGVSGP